MSDLTNILILGFLVLVAIGTAIAYRKYYIENPDGRSDELEELDLNKETDKDILQKLEAAGKPVFELSVMMEKYPYAFALFADDYPDPRKWDALFDTKRFSITYSLKKFFAKHGFYYTKKETLNYDKRFEAIRVVEYQVLITKKHEKYQEPVYKASGNPFEIIPHSIECAFDFINTECVNGRIEPVEYHVPLSKKSAPPA